MAVKIIRQPKKIALLGAPTSAATLRGGQERAPSAVRAAGLADRLGSTGFEVSDLGDTATYTFQTDDEHPRARNVPGILKSLNDLRPRVEAAVKSGALPLILSGDCISVLATIAASRRYYRNVSLIYIDGHADLNVPATTPSGCVDGMVISHVIGRGAPELVRFWGEPPLVREPDIALFGFERLDLPEEQYLLKSMLRRHPALEVTTVGGAVAARTALERVHAGNHQFILHVDIDVIRRDEFPWTNFTGQGGLTLSELHESLRIFTSQSNLLAIEVAGYNPDLDPEGAGAKLIVDLLVDALSTRLETALPTGGDVPEPVATSSQQATAPPQESSESAGSPKNARDDSSPSDSTSS